MEFWTLLNFILIYIQNLTQYLNWVVGGLLFYLYEYAIGYEKAKFYRA